MFILETDVVSELRKVRIGKADENVAKWADSVATPDLYLSVITIQELEIEVLLAERCDAEKGALFRTWLNSHVLPAFEGQHSAGRPSGRSAERKSGKKVGIEVASWA
jgi:hypothetical protein